MARPPLWARKWGDPVGRELRARADRSFDSLHVVATRRGAPVGRLPLRASSAYGMSPKIGADNAHTTSELAAYVAATVNERFPDAA